MIGLLLTFIVWVSDDISLTNQITAIICAAFIGEGIAMVGRKR